jgi:hypothetical protein
VIVIQVLIIEHPEIVELPWETVIQDVGEAEMAIQVVGEAETIFAIGHGEMAAMGRRETGGSLGTTIVDHPGVMGYRISQKRIVNWINLVGSELGENIQVTGTIDTRGEKIMDGLSNQWIGENMQVPGTIETRGKKIRDGLSNQWIERRKITTIRKRLVGMIAMMIAGTGVAHLVIIGAATGVEAETNEKASTEKTTSKAKASESTKNIEHIDHRTDTTIGIRLPVDTNIVTMAVKIDTENASTIRFRVGDMRPMKSPTAERAEIEGVTVETGQKSDAGMEIAVTLKVTNPHSTKKSAITSTVIGIDQRGIGVGVAVLLRTTKFVGGKGTGMIVDDDTVVMGTTIDHTTTESAISTIPTNERIKDDVTKRRTESVIAKNLAEAKHRVTLFLLPSASFQDVDRVLRDNSGTPNIQTRGPLYGIHHLKVRRHISCFRQQMCELAIVVRPQSMLILVATLVKHPTHSGCARMSCSLSKERYS